MAVKVTKKGSETVSAAMLLKQFQKDMGEGVGTLGGYAPETDRIPTGLFELDLALAGGFPKGKVSMIFGPESSNKTNIALLAIANHQRLWPELTCVFVDLENEFNPDWAKLLGVQVDKLIVLKPAYAEQAIDMIEGLLGAEDVGLVVLDSLAAMVGTAELDKSAEGENPGAAGRIASKLYRRTTVALTESAKRKHYPTLIYINQITYKIGVMYGNPETTPGGKKPWFQCALVLRVHGSNVIDKKVSDVMPVRKEVNFVVKKFKIPLLAASGKFEMATMPHGALKVGQCHDAPTIKTFLEVFGEWEQVKGGWKVWGAEYKTQKDWSAKLYGDTDYGAKLRHYVTQRALEENSMIPAQGDNPDE